MTYCVGLFLNEGLVMLADTRTNAGIDNIATYSKTFTWEKPGDRAIALMTAGNLAVTQATVNLINEGLPNESDEDGPRATMYTVPSLFEAARLVGRALRRVQKDDAEVMQTQETPFSATFLLGGQLKGRSMRLFHIYTEGNFIAATPETPFLQIGENKYGKPILDRALNYEDTTVTDATKLALLSMDSTIRSNLSVGYPLNLIVYRKDEYQFAARKKIEENDPYVTQITSEWSETLRSAYLNLSPPDWF